MEVNLLRKSIDCKNQCDYSLNNEKFKLIKSHKFNLKKSYHRYYNYNNGKLNISLTNQNIIIVLLVLINLLSSILATPIFVDNPSIAQFQSGRNIRHLPCVVRKTGLSGTCMFAIDCIKQNGTHLGTCIDRFYFGSCCQLKEESSFYASEINDNSIDQNTISHFSHDSTTSIPSSSLFKITTDNHLHLNGTKSKPTSPINKKPYDPIQSENREEPIKTSLKPTHTSSTTSFSSSSISSTSSTSSLSPSTSKHPSTISVPGSSTSQTSSYPTSYSTMPISQSFSSYSNSGGLASTALISKRPSLSTTPFIISTTSTTKPSRPTFSTSKLPILTTEKTTAQAISSTESSKFSTFQVVETTTAIPINSTRKPVSTIKVTSTKPTSTNKTKPIQSKRPTKGTRKPISSTKPISSVKPVSNSTSFATTKKPPPKATTIRIKPLSTRRTTTVSPTKYATPQTERPITTLHTKLTNLINSTRTSMTTTEKPLTTKNEPTLSQAFNHTNSIIHFISTKPTKITLITKIPLTTKVPRPKPQPTAEIVRTTASPILNEISSKTEETTTHVIKTTSSTLKPVKPSITTPSTAKPMKPLLITKPTLTSSTTTTTTTTNNSKPTHSSSTIVSSTTLSSKIPLNNTSFVFTTTTLKSIINETMEISVTTLKPGLVTWTNDVNSNLQNNLTDNEDWQPRPPPDWVPLPTITPESEANKTDGNNTIHFSPGHQDLTTEGIDSSSTEPILNVSSTTTSSAPIYNASTIQENYQTTEGLIYNNNVTSPDQANISISNTTPYPIPSLEGLDYKQICGKRMFPEPRIVGGANAAFGRWPWQISLRQWRTSTYLHKCGAALLNENWAITAAHCVDNVPPSDLLLRLGEYDLAEEEEPYGYQERRVQIVASHPQFDQRTFEYDLALLRFYEPVIFQPNIIPVCVPDNDYDFLGQTAYVTGWGRLYEDGPLPSVLQEVSVPVINNTICETMYRAAGYIEHIPHIFICAGWKKGGYDSCEGDSGGPMVLQRDDKRFVLGGVISWGIGCAEPNQPGVYTRISEFRDWINQILQF